MLIKLIHDEKSGEKDVKNNSLNDKISRLEELKVNDSEFISIDALQQERVKEKA